MLMEKDRIYMLIHCEEQGRQAEGGLGRDGVWPRMVSPPIDRGHR